MWKESDMEGAARRYKFTVADYERMGEAGLFAKGPRVELLGGEIVEMSPIGSRHAACVDKLAKVLGVHCGDAAIVRSRNPIVLDNESEPEPDVSLLRPRADFYASGHPEPENILLAIEVADSSLHFDRDVKSPLYATAGVQRLWIVDLNAGAIDVCDEPVDGAYQRVRRFLPGERLALPVGGDRSLDVADVLP